jgi:nitrite reductase/ring-hydroxylating ferredoxin subunit/multimeric flavodoxin WrbA
VTESHDPKPPADAPAWIDLGPAAALEDPSLREITIGRAKVALSFRNGTFGAVSGVCNHAAGPLGQGRLDGDYIVCPWHAWKFHHASGLGEPGFEDDRIPRYDLKLEGGHLFISAAPATARHKKPHAPHPLARKVERGDGPIRVLGLSTTAMDARNPRYSTSDALLESAIAHAAGPLGADTRLIKLNDLNFRHCEGYYSKAAPACTWPCSITQMDATDQLDAVYDALVHWADVVVVATSIRWGNASSLYYKMVERMNCVQNQITIRNRFLIKNKVAAFIITGGQDNVQAVAGQMLGFFSEIGFVFPPYPFIAHSRGWDAEDMERNVAQVAHSQELHDGAREIAGRAVATAKALLAGAAPDGGVPRGGRKAHRLDAID